MELARVEIGDTVLVIGPGPLGIYTAAFCMERGASQVIMFGTERGVERMKIAESFGCTTVNVNETTPEERKEMLQDLTHGIGPDVVFDAAGTRHSVPEAIDVCSRGGTVAVTGVAVPQGETAVSMYEQVALKNLRLQGVWVSDARHMYEAVQLALSGKYPFDRMVTHRYPLTEANEALAALERREGIKMVLEPETPRNGSHLWPGQR
jgi:threonine dehydrogenase-like Zn-dependent dehydrogenase